MGGHESHRYFEDFVVGERFDTNPREVTAEDLKTFANISGDHHALHSLDASIRSRGAPILHGPFGIAVFMGMFHELDLVGDSVLGLLDTHWQYRAPVFVGDTLRARFTVTSCRPTSSGTRGVVNRYVEMTNQHAELVQCGSTAVLLAARGEATMDSSLAFGSVEWGRRVAQSLASDERFGASTANWDGTIAIRCGDDEVHFRIYRGEVIAVERRALHGATFIVHASAITWTELILGSRNDFVARAMTGQFTVTGDGYEYLRLTTPLVLLVDAARRVAGTETA